MDKRLLTATPKGKERSIFVDNSKHAAGVGVSRTTSGVFVSKHKFDFIVRICLYYTLFMNEFEVVSVFRSSRITLLMLLTNLFMFVHFNNSYRHRLLNISFRLIVLCFS